MAAKAAEQAAVVVPVGLKSGEGEKDVHKMQVEGVNVAAEVQGRIAKAHVAEGRLNTGSDEEACHMTRDRILVVEEGVDTETTDRRDHR